MIFKKIRKSFKYAWAGLRFFVEERNIKIHLCFTLMVIVLGLLFCINIFEWVVLILTICLVLSLEIINTAIENFIDLLHPEESEKVMIIKDLAAAAVFVSALGSILVGIFIFFPYILGLLQ